MSFAASVAIMSRPESPLAVSDAMLGTMHVKSDRSEARGAEVNKTSVRQCRGGTNKEQ